MRISTKLTTQLSLGTDICFFDNYSFIEDTMWTRCL